MDIHFVSRIKCDTYIESVNFIYALGYFGYINILALTIFVVIFYFAKKSSLGG